MPEAAQPSASTIRRQAASLTIAVAAASLVAVAFVPIWPSILAASSRVRFQTPDLGLIAHQPTTVQIHLYAALAALVLGWILIAARKGRRFHRIAGWTWVSLAAAVAGSSLFITGLNGDKWSLLHLLAGWTFLVLPLGVAAAKRSAVSAHRRWMTGLFYGGFAINLVIAFLPGRLLWSVAFG